MSEYLNVNEVASELKITTTSIYKIVNHDDPRKRIEPVNRATYKGDGGYRFSRDEVERIKPLYVKKDLTSSQAAEQISRSKSFLQKLLKGGVIPYYVEELCGQKTYFIKEEDLAEYSRKNPDSGKYNTIYDKKSGAFLFQPYKKDDLFARIVEMKRVHRNKIEIVLQGESGTRFPYEKAITEGWEPTIRIALKKPNSAYGYARFDFPFPDTIDSMIYKVLEELFKQVGPTNMRISTGERLIVEIKKAVLLGILPTTHPDLVDKLKLFITTGEIVPKYDGTLIDTGLSPITFYLPESKKAALIAQAELEGVSLQEWLESQF